MKDLKVFYYNGEKLNEISNTTSILLSRGIIGLFSTDDLSDEDDMLVFYGGRNLNRGFHQPKDIESSYDNVGFQIFLKDELKLRAPYVSEKCLGIYNLEADILTLDIYASVNDKQKLETILLKGKFGYVCAN